MSIKIKENSESLMKLVYTWKCDMLANEPLLTSTIYNVGELKVANIKLTSINFSMVAKLILLTTLWFLWQKQGK